MDIALAFGLSAPGFDSWLSNEDELKTALKNCQLYVQNDLFVFAGRKNPLKETLSPCKEHLLQVEVRHAAQAVI
jgi:hypothetical protein